MQRYEHRFTAMGSPCRIRLDHADEAKALTALDAAAAEVRRLEHKYSRYLPHSLAGAINAGAGSGQATAIDEETARLLDYADTLWRRSEGQFDITASILRRVWRFKSAQLPRQATIDALLPLIDWRAVAWDQRRIYLPRAGMEVDFGGFVKEYASDSAVHVLRGCGIRHALVDLGGDIAVLGTAAHGRAWTVGIRNPMAGQAAIAKVALTGGGLATSGDYERCITVDGRRYGHILNPRTGWPVEGLVAVSALADQCLVAGSVCTLALLKPQREALDWLTGMGLPWLAIDRRQQVHGTLL